MQFSLIPCDLTAQWVRMFCPQHPLGLHSNLRWKWEATCDTDTVQAATLRFCVSWCLLVDGRREAKRSSAECYNISPNFVCSSFLSEWNLFITLLFKYFDFVTFFRVFTVFLLYMTLAWVLLTKQKNVLHVFLPLLAGVLKAFCITLHRDQAFSVQINVNNMTNNHASHSVSVSVLRRLCTLSFVKKKRNMKLSSPLSIWTRVLNFQPFKSQQFLYLQ